MKIISCSEAITRMFELLQGEINKTQKNELDRHLASCRECCSRMEFEELLKEKISELSRTDPPKRLLRRLGKLTKSF